MPFIAVPVFGGDKIAVLPIFLERETVANLRTDNFPVTDRSKWT